MIRTVAIVSLSSGILGEAAVKHELDIGLKRLGDYGLSVRLMPHALAGLKALREHPEWRAADLLAAFRDPEVDMILCAIGGDDTYRLLPWLFDRDALKKAACQKVFLGFSDTTVNHLMLHKLGLRSFYGQSFLADVCELGPEMLPYSRRYFEELIATGGIRAVSPSDVWYRERTDFGPASVGKALPPLPDDGFELLQGPGVFSGRILGGCIDSMYDLFHPDRYPDMPALCERYGLFPPKEDWRGRILLLESSEERMPPAQYRTALWDLRERGVFDAVSGVLVGKPMDKTYEAEYRRLLVEVVGDRDLPIVYNVNIGHAQPRCILPFGVPATVDVPRQVITFEA